MAFIKFRFSIKRVRKLDCWCKMRSASSYRNVAVVRKYANKNKTLYRFGWLGCINCRSQLVYCFRFSQVTEKWCIQYGETYYVNCANCIFFFCSQVFLQLRMGVHCLFFSLVVFGIFCFYLETVYLFFSKIYKGKSVFNRFVWFWHVPFLVLWLITWKIILQKKQQATS